MVGGDSDHLHAGKKYRQQNTVCAPSKGARLELNGGGCLETSVNGKLSLCGRGVSGRPRRTLQKQGRAVETASAPAHRLEFYLQRDEKLLQIGFYFKNGLITIAQRAPRPHNAELNFITNLYRLKNRRGNRGIHT